MGQFIYPMAEMEIKMKRIIVLLILLSQFLSFTACVKEPNTSKIDGSEGTNNLSTQNTSGISKDSTDSLPMDNGFQSAIDSIPFGIVAESGNSISSEDKEKVIKKLEKELSTLFDSINRFQDNEGTNVK